MVLYLKESYDELMHKVSWPKFPELLGSTRVVIVASIIFALLVLVIDLISKTITDFFYHLNL
ncbi:MAG TPA: preprotein translocase subunit SecE [Bacteroidetes bacterium]|nr:preprotein translocase subunit SecE [Bacteroidota bacterium]